MIKKPNNKTGISRFLISCIPASLESHRGDAFRAVYTANFAEAIYVLHVFLKKSKHGIATPKPDVELIRSRFTEAERLHRDRRN